jgi:hypothetical protein
MVHYDYLISLRSTDWCYARNSMAGLFWWKLVAAQLEVDFLNRSAGNVGMVVLSLGRGLQELIVDTRCCALRIIR